MTLSESTLHIQAVAGKDSINDEPGAALSDARLGELKDLIAARGRALAEHAASADPGQLLAALDAGARLERLLKDQRRALMLEAVRASHIARYGI